MRRFSRNSCWKQRSPAAGGAATGDDSEPPLVPSGSGVDLTAEGSMIGTLAYAPPEQVDGRTSQVDQRSDVYGLGAILYELLTGRPPIQGDSYDELISKVKAGDIRPPRTLIPATPVSLEAIAMKALSRVQADRYATAGQLRSDVEAWLDDLPISATREPFVERTRRWARKHPAIVASSTLTVVLGLLVSAGYSILSSRSQAALEVKNYQVTYINTSRRSTVASLL